MNFKQDGGGIIKINDVIHLVAKEKYNIHINWLGKPVARSVTRVAML